MQAVRCGARLRRMRKTQAIELSAHIRYDSGHGQVSPCRRTHFMSTPIRQTLFVSLSLVLVAASTPADSHGDDNWPQFRGPHATGVGESDRLPDRWSADDNVEWKTEIPGRGWSSPIVWGDRIFLTTVENRGSSPDPKKGLYFKGEQHEPPDSIHLCHRLGLNYVSCSPFRVPVARLAAAQAAIGEGTGTK